jgi:hypothetical protein
MWSSMRSAFRAVGASRFLEQIELYRERLGIQKMGFRLHWPGKHECVLWAISLLGERVLPLFA